ncbi:MAG: hypothetical protein ABI193_08250 [Minicystis sp.]
MDEERPTKRRQRKGRITRGTNRFELAAFEVGEIEEIFEDDLLAEILRVTRPGGHVHFEVPTAGLLARVFGGWARSAWAGSSRRWRASPQPESPPRGVSRC